MSVEIERGRARGGDNPDLTGSSLFIPILSNTLLSKYKYFIARFTFAQLLSPPLSQLIMLGGINLIFQYLTIQTVILFWLTSLVLAHVIPYLLDPHHIRKYPGPFFAKFTDAWFGVICKQGHRSEIVHQLHLKYGAFGF